MTEQSASKTKRSWLMKHGTTLFAADLYLGMLAGLAAGSAAVLSPSIREDNVSTVLGWEAAIGLALLAVALTALAILVGVLDDHYIRVLKYAGGVDRALAPYQAISVVSALAVFSALINLLIDPLIPDDALAVGFGITTMFTVWALWGTVELVNITAKHGLLRSQLLDVIQDARQRVATVDREQERSAR